VIAASAIISAIKDNVERTLAMGQVQLRPLSTVASVDATKQFLSSSPRTIVLDPFYVGNEDPNIGSPLLDDA
jgi:hypothetical protein